MHREKGSSHRLARWFREAREAKSAALGLSLAAGTLLGFLDFLTGPFLQFPFFFLLPIAVAAWYGGRIASFPLAFLLPLARPLIWFPIWRHGPDSGEVAELGMRVLIGNAAIKILVFTLFAEMLHRIADAARFRQQVIAALPIGLWVADRRGKIVQASPAGKKVWGIDALGRDPGSAGIASRAAADSADLARPGFRGLDAALREGRSEQEEPLRIARPDGEERDVLSSSAPIRDARGGIAGALLVQVDVTGSKRLEEERETLIRSLQTAQRDIKILKGILPICSGCKRIRDEKKSWVHLESYISSHSEADFSHGICPECMEKMYPWFAP